MEELDEFGIPIKKTTNQPAVDEFGIPIKKKVDTTSSLQKSKSVSETNTGSLGGLKISDGLKKQQPLPKINKVLQEAINKPENVAKRKEFQRQEILKWRASTKLNDVEKQESQNELLAKKKQEGVWNNVKAIGSDIINKASEFVFSMTDEGSTPKDLKLETDPLFKEKQQAKSTLREQGVSVTPESVGKLADKIYLDNANLEKKQQKINTYLQGVDPKTKSALQIDAEDRFKTLSKSKRELTDRISLNEKHFEEILSDLENPSLSEEEKSSLGVELKKSIDYLKTDYNTFSKQTDELGTAQDEFDAFKRNYNALDNVMSRASLSLTSAGISMYSGANYLANTFGAGEENRQEGIQKAREFVEERKNEFRPENKDITLGNFFQYSTDLLANQTGTLAQIGAGGIGGVVALGVEGAGDKYSEMHQSNKSGKTNYSPTQMMLAPFVSGLSEAVFAELPTMKTLKNSASVWKSAMKEVASKELVENAIKNTSGDIVKKFLNNHKRELITEEINNLVQNTVKKDIQGDKSVGYLDNSIHLAKDTLLLTSMINGTGALPQIGWSVVKTYSEKAQSKQLDINAKKITDLLGRLEDKNVSEVTKKVIKEQIDLATNQSSKIINETIDKMGKMPLNQIEIVYNNSKRIVELQTEANEIKDDLGLEDSSKIILLNGLKEEHKSLQETNAGIINGSTTPVESLPLKEQDKVKKEALNELIQELNPERTKNIKIDNEQITERANQIYLKQQKDAEIESTVTEVKPEVEPKTEVQEPTNAEQEKVDESVQNGDIIPDGSVPIRDNTDLQQQQVEDMQPSAIVGESEATPKVKKYKLTEKGQAFNVENKNGKLEVTTNDGKLVSKPTERAVLRKHADNIDFTIGEKAIDNPNFEAKDWENEVATKSNNPAEIADTIHYAEIEDVSNMSDVEKKSHTEQIIADGLVPIKESGFDRFGDTNNKTKKTKSYFDNENGREIDDLAQELSDRAGVEISPNDIADFIAEYPDGMKSYHEKVKGDLTQEQIAKSNKIEALKTKFTELTGLPANKEFLLKAIEQQNRKENGNNALDQLSDAELTAKYNEILESQKQTDGSTETKQDAKGIDEKQNITAPETTSGEGAKREEVSSDSRREKSSEEKAKDLGIDHDKYLDFKDIVEGVPLSGVFKEYVSGKTIEDVFGEKGTNDQSYEAMALLDASTHGDTVLAHAKELFGENYIPKTLEFLQGTKTDNFEKAVVYASLENLMDSLVKENPSDKSLKSLQDLVYRDSQANLSNSSKGLNAGRLRRIHNAIKNGYDVEKLTDQILTDKQKEAKTVLQGIDISGEALNKESDKGVSPELEKLIQEGVQKEIDKFKEKLPTARRIKADKAIKALEEIQKSLRNKTYDATIGVPIAILDSGVTVIKNAINIGINVADAIEMGIAHIKEKYGKDWENEDRFRQDYTEGLKEKNIDLKKKKSNISDVVKQALIDSGFSREIKIKGETKKVLDWVKLTGRMNNVDALRDNVETKLKEQGYDDKKITDISNELELEYKRIVNDVIDKSVADLERRDLIKPSPNRKSENRKLADLYNQGLFGDNIKKYENVVNSILGFSDIDHKKYSEIQEKAKALSDIYFEKVDGKSITELSVSSIASKLNKDISDLLTLSAIKEGSAFFKTTELFKQFSSLGLKSLLGSIKGLAENKFSGEYAGILQRMVVRGQLTDALRKQFNKNANVVLSDITKQGGLDYGNTSTTLISGSLLEDMASNKIKSKIGHQILTAITIRRFLNGYDSYIKNKLTERLFVTNSIKILEKKGFTKEKALNHISEALTGDSFDKALVTAKNIIDNVNSKQETKQLKDHPEAIHRFAMDIVRQNLMNDNVMTMEEVQKSFDASYKGAGSDIGHEANNFVSKNVARKSQELSKELNDAIKDKNWKLASLKNIEMMLHKVVISPFAGGGSNWIVIGAEKGVPIIGYIPTLSNALNRTELDLESVTGKKNIEKSLYYDYKTKASFVRNISSTGMAITAYITMTGMSGFGLKDDDEENNAKKLNDWLNENDWAKPYFNKLSPFAFVMASAVEEENYGKLLAQTFGMSGEVFNNSLKVIKSLDSDKEGATKGAIGKLLGQFGNSPIAWKYLLDAVNVSRGLKGQSQIKTDYELESFLDGFYQGGFFEATGLVIDDLKGIEPSSKKGSSKSIKGLKKVKKKTYRKF